MMDVRSLLQPIRPDAPAGSDLRQDAGESLFLDVREMRRREDPALVAPGLKAKEADFAQIATRCTPALTRRTKDLELAVYLIEAWTATHGLEGLADGIEFLDGLVEGFWPQLWPGLEFDGGKAEIIGPIRAKWLNWVGGSREFLDTVRTVPITAGEGGALALRDSEHAARMADAMLTNTTLFAELQQSGRTTPDQWARAIAATPVEHLTNTRSHATRCLANLAKLEARCDELLGKGEAPSFRGLRETLEKIVAIQSGDASAPADPANTMATADSQSSHAPALATGPLRSRQDAVAALQQVARFLRQTEPHSPVSFLVERCVRWLSMGFEEVMKDLVENDDTMSIVRKTLGLGPAAEK